MIFSDADIRKALKDGSIKMEAEHDVLAQIGPASIDFRLGNTFKRYLPNKIQVLDPEKGVAPDQTELITIPDGEGFVLKPGDFVLGVTKEKITLGRDTVARCEGRSSLGRLGLIIHSTAGYIDPGFSGTITLEITNINTVPLLLRPGMRIGQFSFDKTLTPCDVSYAERKGSKYMHQTVAQESRVGQDWEFAQKK